MVVVGFGAKAHFVSLGKCFLKSLSTVFPASYCLKYLSLQGSGDCLANLGETMFTNNF